MVQICDYIIIQRDENGVGKGLFSGKNKIGKNQTVVSRVMREDDNMTIIPWRECKVKNNNWSIELDIPEGGLYRVEARLVGAPFNEFTNAYDWGAMINCAYHVGVGDNFVLAGQSNMSGYGKDFAYDPPELGVHLMNNNDNWVLAAHPLNCSFGDVSRNNDENSGTSPGLSFGRMMKKRLGVPIGLIACAEGGTTLDTWDPYEKDSYLYTHMSEKIKMAGGVKAILWYQGCSDTEDENDTNTYLERFKRTVKLWREDFGNLPIVSCQMNRHAWKGEDRDRRWGIVREAQRRASIEIPNVFIVPTVDMGTCDGIHNASGANVIVGERIAGVALKGIYGLPGYFAPNIKSVKKVDSDKIKLEFYEKHIFRTMDDIATGINIEDDNGMMKCISISVTFDGVIVKGERNIEGNAKFHAYWEREVPAFFLKEFCGLPMIPCFNVPIE